MCNVVLPSVVKRDFADRITLVTGGYSAVMGTFAALASGIALPVANVIGDGWRWSLGMWAIPSALGAAIWGYRARTRRGFVPISMPPPGCTRRDCSTARCGRWSAPA